MNSSYQYVEWREQGMSGDIRKIDAGRETGYVGKNLRGDGLTASGLYGVGTLRRYALGRRRLDGVGGGGAVFGAVPLFWRKIAMDAPTFSGGICVMANDSVRRGPEGLRVYWLALDFLSAVDGLIERLPTKGTLGEQLRRAAESIVLNIAEGAAHIAAGTKIYHYELAYASAHECLAALHALGRRYTSVSMKVELRMVNMICVMLVSLIKRERERATEK
jgi:four helix bundle protein